MKRDLWSWVGTLLLLGAIGTLMLGCPAGNDDDDDDSGIKAGWLYVGPPGDLGWTYAHNQGREYAEANVEGLTTTYIENVTEAAAEAKMQELIDSGHDIIFTTSFDHMNPTLNMANANAGVYFEHCSGYESADNMANYFGRMYQARYLSGIVAGSMTTSKKIGIPGAVPIPEVIRHVNAITLGARSVDPTIEVHVEWVNAWYDPTTAATKTQALIDAGCDVIMQDTDSQAPITTAQTAGVYAVGYNSDVLSFATDTVLTSAVWNWGPYYVDRINAVKNGTWTTQSYWGGIDSGIVDLGQWGSMVPQSVKDAVATAQSALAAGTYDVFDGPFNKQDGSAWIADGASMSDGDMLGMSEFVEGVVGTLP